MKVMVVDDEEDIQFLFKQKFRREIKDGKIEFNFALSAEAALDYLQKQGEASVVLLLSDINMPGMNGLELLKIIKTNYKSLKVIMITAYGDENTYQKAIAYGANDYVNKPINFDNLKRLVFGEI
ncbi:response regulator [Planktothrix sp. FACHB-1355]|uniref:Response regulator n=1 Tax=Aerosakkonema funiforme FACHB-1375 TaxID=2949571 RepID=A0A926VF93_9CYAN|nr:MULTISPECIES: response regulator [Oscillatoriales]MBD2182800.1 response regulator [Aerosakkonema funiforme FACHB-1375]MBD3558020.1 response regulator [Planktothrix sp. FACHB-1355]